MKFSRVMLGCLCALASISASTSGVHATESGTNHYPIGVNTVLPALLPPPNVTEYLNYLQYYNAGVLAGPDGNRVAPGFHANVTAEVARILHTWPTRLGPFGMTSGIVQSVVNADIRAPRSSGPQDRLAFGDTVLQPLFLTYAHPARNFFSYFGPSIYIPDGSYSKGHAVNIGLNHWGIAPDAAITWFPTPRIQVSLEGVVEFNAQNDATKYKGGDAVSFDFGLDYQPLEAYKRFHVGINGYAYQQFTDDTLNGRVFRGGNRGRTIALGPQFRYDWKLGGIVIKYQREFAVQNRTSGDRFWIQFAVPIF